MIESDEATMLAKDIVTILEKRMSDQDAESYSFLISVLSYVVAVKSAEKNGWDYVLSWFAPFLKAEEVIALEIHERSGCNCDGHADKYDS